MSFGILAAFNWPPYVVDLFERCLLYTCSTKRMGLSILYVSRHVPKFALTVTREDLKVLHYSRTAYPSKFGYCDLQSQRRLCSKGSRRSFAATKNFNWGNPHEKFTPSPLACRYDSWQPTVIHSNDSDSNRRLVPESREKKDKGMSRQPRIGPVPYPLKKLRFFRFFLKRGFEGSARGRGMITPFTEIFTRQITVAIGNGTTIFRSTIEASM